MRHEAKNPVGSIRTTFRILRALEASDGRRIADITSAVDATKGTVHNHLATLREDGYVVQRGNRYYLGSRLVRFGSAVREQSPLYRHSLEELRSLAQSTGESACIAVEEEGYVVYQHVVPEGADDSRLIAAGARIPLHQSAPGKCLLATRSNDDIRSYLEEFAETDPAVQTVPDSNEVIQEMQTVREQNLAFSRGEFAEELYEVATDISTGDPSVQGAIGVFGPKERMSGKSLQQDIAGLVLNAAKRVEVAIHRASV